MIVRPEDFNSETPPPRIIGVECEYNLQFPSNVSLSQYINDESLAAAGISHHGSFLGQRGGGGKLYADVGHLEFDTDERLGPASATMADLDGIAILGRIVEKSGQTYDGLYRLAGTSTYPMVAFQAAMMPVQGPPLAVPAATMRIFLFLAKQVKTH